VGSQSQRRAPRIRLCGGHPLPDGATQWAQTLNIHVLDLPQTMKAAPQWKRSRQEQPQQVQLSQRGYCYHRCTEEAANRTTVTNFEGDSLHSDGLHYHPDTDVYPVEGTYGDTVRRGPWTESPSGEILYKLRETSSPQAIWDIEEERVRGELPA